MLSKWFKRKSVPKNDGDSGISGMEKHKYVKVFELELSNMEDTPVYTLTHQLSVGSEIGNIIIADPSVSPRHASFVLQQDVVSVIDHGSVAGTYVNGKKIPSGKYFILEESDTILLGELEIKLRAGRAAVIAEDGPKEEEVPEAEDDYEDELPPPVVEAPVEEELPPEDPIEEKKQKVEYYRPPQRKNEEPVKAVTKPKTKKKSLTISAPQPAANALVRVMAIAADFIVAYGLLIVLMPFDEFRDFLNFVPDSLSALLGMEWTNLWTLLQEDYGFVTEIIQDLYNFLSGVFDFVPLLIVFIVLRMITTLILGVSISELMLGVRGTGNGIWSRVGGVIRVLVGVLTWPFVIFDLPALISKRTLKEVLTFTRIYNPSKFATILGIILYIPLTVAFVLVSPLIQGFEPPEPILISDKIDQRVKVKVPGPEVTETPAEAATPETTTAETPATGTIPADTATTETVAPEVVPEVLPVSANSQVMNFKITYMPDELLIIPDFKFKGVKSKLKVSSSLLFYQKDLQRSVDVEILKTFDMKQLLSFGMKGNIFLYDKYPQIYNFVYEAKDKNPAFKKSLDAKSQMAFANEFIQFTKTAFSLSTENAFDIMQLETPLIKGLVDYKASFLSLIEYKEFDDVGFIKIGNTIFMRISFFKQRPFDLLIPLIKGRGTIYKVTFDRKENFKTVQNKFYKYNLNETDWLPEGQELSPGSLTAPEVFDLFSNENVKGIFQSNDLAQSLYAYYFETSASIMKNSDPVEMDLWKDRVLNMLKLLEELPSAPVAEGTEDIKSKLLQNFRDMQDALESNNAEYFGISTTTTV